MTLTLALLFLGGPLLKVEEWIAPERLPFPRVHALAWANGEWFVGGLAGLARGNQNQWIALDERPVCEIATHALSIWVLFGDGSVDKIEPKDGRLFYDVLSESAKRPWASCLASDGKTLVFGGAGGWIERDGKSQREMYPAEFKGQVVTAALRDGDSLWLGTQGNGLWRKRAGKLMRFGLGAGLPDLWVTALAATNGQLIVAMAEGGVFAFQGGSISKVECPARKVRKLGVFRERLVVGDFRGTWIQHGSSWQRLGDEECTGLGVGTNRLAVATPRRVTWWESP